LIDSLRKTIASRPESIDSGQSPSSPTQRRSTSARSRSSPSQSAWNPGRQRTASRHPRSSLHERGSTPLESRPSPVSLPLQEIDSQIPSVAIVISVYLAVPPPTHVFTTEFLAHLAERDEGFAQELRLAATVKWYELELVSQGRAAEIAGITRSEFLDAFSPFGVSPLSVRGRRSPRGSRPWV